MADLIDRDAVEGVITNALNGYLTDDVRNTLEGIGIAISDMPSAVVRCKDCIYCELSIDELDAWCNVWGNTTVCDGYCFYGKRKNDE